MAEYNKKIIKMVDYEAMRAAFDKKFKETMKLVRNGETHLDNLAEGFHEADRVIFQMPSADVVERKRGEWEFKPPNGWACSACGEWGLMIDNRGICKSNFCPNCGADMRGDGHAQ